MANFTKKAIREAFIQLLEERPLSQITVKDIVDRCGVNRNTFYYYYQDIPQLLETIVSQDVDRIIQARHAHLSFRQPGYLRAVPVAAVPLYGDGLSGRDALRPAD